MRTLAGISMFLLVSILLGSVAAMSQGIPEITAEDCPGFSLTRNESFDGGSLWGYMNGGADIYLEYGFVAMRVEEFSNNEERIKLELFKMADPIAAYGIFSIKTFRCQQEKVMAAYDCLNRFQFQFINGDYYIQLINESGSEKAKQAMLGIAEALLKRTGPSEIKLPVRYLTDHVEISPLTLKMVKGRIGLQDKLMSLSDSFEGLEGYQVYYANTEEDGEKVRYYEVIFDEPGQKDRYVEIIKGRGLQIIKEDGTTLLMKQ